MARSPSANVYVCGSEGRDKSTAVVYCIGGSCVVPMLPSSACMIPPLAYDNPTGLVYSSNGIVRGTNDAQNDLKFVKLTADVLEN